MYQCGARARGLIVLNECCCTDAVVSIDDLKQLLQQAIAIFQTEATVVDLPAPCKVFGDIHGQFTDLKKFFATYGVSGWLYRLASTFGV
jgi:hypothetical protein